MDGIHSTFSADVERVLASASGEDRATARTAAAPQGASLGNIERSVVSGTADTPPGPFGKRELESWEVTANMLRRARYSMQQAAQALLPDQAVSDCLKKRAVRHGDGAPTLSPGVNLLHSPSRKRARVNGVHRCSSVWACPICSAQISAVRAEQLREGVSNHRSAGGSVVMLTLTARHTREDKLGHWLLKFLEAVNRFKQRRDTTRRKLRPEAPPRWNAKTQGSRPDSHFLPFSWGWNSLVSAKVMVGSVSTLEVTHGGNGWHPHVHIMCFFGPGVTPDQGCAIIERLRATWIHVLDSNGLSGNEHAFHVKSSNAVEEWISDYISKYGVFPQHVEEVAKQKWCMHSEMTLQIRKVGKNALKKDQRNAWQLLADYVLGEKRAGALFREYAGVFKGRRQLTWSPGLKERLGVLDQSDEEIIEQAETDTDDEVIVRTLNPAEWQAVVRSHKRVDLLEVCEREGLAGVNTLIEGLMKGRKPWVPPASVKLTVRKPARSPRRQEPAAAEVNPAPAATYWWNDVDR